MTNLRPAFQLRPAPPENQVGPEASQQLGVSMPPLVIEDLPSPEEVFGARRIGPAEIVFMILGPAMIALSLAVGSGEWVLGPMAVGQFGFKGIGFIIMLSITLQTFYNIELARFTLATGETPVEAFGRVPPGALLWVPLALTCFYGAFLLSGWAGSAGASLFALFMGRPHNPQELETVHLLAVLLLFLTFLFTLFGKRIERSMEISQGIVMVMVLISLLAVTLAVVPVSYWSHALGSLVTVARPPRGSDVSLLGALAGFAGIGSGLNFMVTGYYRDKGYGMGHRTGFIPGLFGGKRVAMRSGRIFPETEHNSALWKRWFHYLLIDQWSIFFVGCILGMMLPCILVGYLSSLPGVTPPDRSNILVFAALQLGQRYGPVLFAWALLVGFALLYTTQICILETLTRCATDAILGTSAWARQHLGADYRRLYYAWMLGLIILISILIHIALPVDLIILSANLTNLAALIFPLAMIYLNRRLPRPARIGWGPVVALLANTLFFGFFFINFLFAKLTGSPLIRF
jgi:hypothetical protein